jgi:hypothetical protein
VRLGQRLSGSEPPRQPRLSPTRSSRSSSNERRRSEGSEATQLVRSCSARSFTASVASWRSVSLLAATEGAEALILARSLLSILARAAYVDAPEDLEERRSRYEQYYVKDLNDRLKNGG